MNGLGGTPYPNTEKQMKISYVEGDLFQHIFAIKDNRPIAIPHVCNDIGAWGAGFVVPLATHFPVTREAYIKWHKAKINEDGQFALGNTQFVRVQPTITVCNMVAQHDLGGVRPLRYHHLAKCMSDVADRMKNPPVAEIHCPMFGSMLSGGNWLFIEELIQDCWLEQGIPVTVYYLPGKYPANWTPPAKEEVKAKSKKK